jgi:hypothetical protein
VPRLRGTSGRGAFAPPAAVQGVPTPASYRAFVRAYDWADPADPRDLYRELSIGRLEGTLRFLRADDLLRLDTAPDWAAAARSGLFPIAHRTGSSLGGAANPPAVIALAEEGGERLLLVEPGRPPRVAGPTFGELVRYLALGWAARTEAQEDMIGALMLRAKLRSSPPG